MAGVNPFFQALSEMAPTTTFVQRYSVQDIDNIMTDVVPIHVNPASEPVKTRSQPVFNYPVAMDLDPPVNYGPEPMDIDLWSLPDAPLPHADQGVRRPNLNKTGRSCKPASPIRDAGAKKQQHDNQNNNNKRGHRQPKNHENQPRVQQQRSLEPQGNTPGRGRQSQLQIKGCASKPDNKTVSPKPRTKATRK